MRASHLPSRLTTGAFILNSGLSKRALPSEVAASLQNMAANAVPAVRKMRPEAFGKTLSAAETALGAALLAPFVPSTVPGPARWAPGLRVSARTASLSPGSVWCDVHWTIRCRIRPTYVAELVAQLDGRGIRRPRRSNSDRRHVVTSCGWCPTRSCRGPASECGAWGMFGPLPGG